MNHLILAWASCRSPSLALSLSSISANLAAISSRCCSAFALGQTFSQNERVLISNWKVKVISRIVPPGSSLLGKGGLLLGSQGLLVPFLGFHLLHLNGKPNGTSTWLWKCDLKSVRPPPTDVHLMVSRSNLVHLLTHLLWPADTLKLNPVMIPSPFW